MCPGQGQPCAARVPQGVEVRAVGHEKRVSAAAVGNDVFLEFTCQHGLRRPYLDIHPQMKENTGGGTGTGLSAYYFVSKEIFFTPPGDHKMRNLSNMAGCTTVLIGLSLATLTATSWAEQPGKSPVKAFVLVGQSNMQGKASLVTLAHQIKAERTKRQFAHLHDGKGNYLLRDDVFINFLERHGKLEVGYGSKDRFGPELGFGWTVGDALDEPVLIIKAAYGGRSLFRDFRSPSAGLPDETRLKEELDGAKKRNPETTMDDVKSKYGFAYRDVLAEVNGVRENYQTLFPELKGKELQLTGFVWFQGWNDMINGEFSAAYTENMVHFIKDVRKDLDAPNLPFVIGQLGVGGPYEGDDPATDKKEVFKANQAAAADRPEFKGNVAVVRTDQYWDPVAAEAYKVWRQDVEAWRHHGNDFAYHYLGSPKIIYEIGEAFGKQMLQILGKSVE